MMNWTTVLLLVGILLIAAGGYVERQDRIGEAARLARETHSVLCAFKVDEQRHLIMARRFLREHPAGVAGISRADLLRSIANQRSTLASLENLVCNEGS